MFDPHNIDHHIDPGNYFGYVRDRARNAPAERARLQVKPISVPTAFEPLPAQPLHPVTDIGPLYYQPQRHLHAASPTRSRNIDALLAKHGIRPRRRSSQAEAEPVKRKRTTKTVREAPPPPSRVEELPADGVLVRRMVGQVLRVR
jgi:hypothetical protein